MLTKEEYLKKWFNQGIEFLIAPCSNACWHCFTNAKINKNKNIKLEDFEYFLQFVKNIKEKYNIKIENEKIMLFFYQELLLHPNWLEISELSEKYGFISVQKLNLATNGSYIARNFDNPNFIKKYRKFSPNWGQLVFHGKRERHDKYVARKGAFDDVVKTAQFFRRENTPILWQYFFSKDNVVDFPEVYSLMEELSDGKPRLRAMIGNYEGRMIKNDNLRPTRKDFEVLSASHIELLNHNLWKEEIFLDNLFTEKEYMDIFEEKNVSIENPSFVDAMVVFNDLSLHYSWEKNKMYGNLRDIDAEEKIFYVFYEIQKFEEILGNVDIKTLFEKYADKEDKMLSTKYGVTKRILLRIAENEKWFEKLNIRLKYI